MFTINSSIATVRATEDNLIKMLYSTSSHPVATPEMSVEEARCYVVFIRESSGIHCTIIMRLPRTNRTFFYSSSDNPIAEEKLEEIENEALTFAEELGMIMAEFILRRRNPLEIAEWIRQGEFLEYELSNETRQYVSVVPKINSDKWSDADKLGYDAFTKAAVAFITHETTKPPFIIGIKARWGAGKTSLMKRIQYSLDKKAYMSEGNWCSRTILNAEVKTTVKELFDYLKAYKISGNDSNATNQSAKSGRTGSIERPTVWFNAWKYQCSEQIWAGLAHCIISQVTARMKPAERERFWLNLHTQRMDVSAIRKKVLSKIIGEFLPAGLIYAAIFIALSALGLGLFVLNRIGVAWVAGISVAGMLPGALHFANHFRAKYEGSLSGILADVIRAPDYAGKLGFLNLVENDIKHVIDLVATEEQPLVIFVDDLDRCVPAKVAEIVEAINLFLLGDYSNCIFILGMEPAVVAAAIEVANKDVLEKMALHSNIGTDMPLGWRFMEKVVQLPIVIPPPTEESLRDYLKDLSRVASMEKSGLNANAEPQGESFGKYLMELQRAGNTADVMKLSEQLLNGSEIIEKPLILEATKRAYSSKLTNDDPNIMNFIQQATLYLQANPRQIKRYVNVFRFLCIVRQYMIIDNISKPAFKSRMPSDAVLAKYVLLCALWPLAVDLLYVQAEVSSDGDDKKISLFAALEKSAKALPVDADSAIRQWYDVLKEMSLDKYPWVASQKFRRFLTAGDMISDYHGCGLW